MRRPSNALRKSDDDQRQNGAERETPILGQRLQLVLQQGEGQRPDEWPEEIREPTEHSHEHELARLSPINQLGIGEPHPEAQDCVRMRGGLPREGVLRDLAWGLTPLPAPLNLPFYRAQK